MNRLAFQVVLAVVIAEVEAVAEAVALILMQEE